MFRKVLKPVHVVVPASLPAVNAVADLADLADLAVVAVVRRLVVNVVVAQVLVPVRRVVKAAVLTARVPVIAAAPLACLMVTRTARRHSRQIMQTAEMTVRHRHTAHRDAMPVRPSARRVHEAVKANRVAVMESQAVDAVARAAADAVLTAVAKPRLARHPNHA